MLEIILVSSLIISGFVNGVFITRELLRRIDEEEQNYRRMERYIEEVKN
jgi:hypothetical protein